MAAPYPRAMDLVPPERFLALPAADGEGRPLDPGDGKPLKLSWRCS